MEKLSALLILMLISSMWSTGTSPPANDAQNFALNVLGTEYYTNSSSLGELLNFTSDKLSEFASNNITSDVQYRDLMKFLAGMGIYESTRIALIEIKEYYIASKDIKEVMYDPFLGLDKRWAPMTAKTTDGKLDVAFSVGTCGIYPPLNPVYGFNFDRWHFLSRVFDQGAYLFNGTYVPYRCNWTIDETAGEVPEDAVIYNQTLGWISPHPGERYEVAITYRCGFGEWHNGVKGSINDTKNFIAFLYAWAYRDFPGDRYYEEKIATDETVFPNVLGFRFDEKGYTVYLKSRDPLVSDLLAEKYLFYPTMPWEMYWAMGELAANEYHYGIWNINYTLIPKEEHHFYPEWDMPIDLADEKTLKDLSSVIEDILEGKAPKFPGIDWNSAYGRLGADLEFYRRYGHMLIGNGPYVFTELDAPNMIYRLEKFEGEREVLGKLLPAEGTPKVMVCYGMQNPRTVLQDILNGDLDLFMDPMPADYYRDLKWYEGKGQLKLYPKAENRYGLVLNPAHNGNAPLVVEGDKVYFNPFAVRDVRLALNYLVNRSYLAEEIPWSVPAFDNLGPVHPGEKNVSGVYELFNLSEAGNWSYGLELFEEGMEKAKLELEKQNHTLEKINGAWYFDGEPMEIILLVDNTPRYNPMDESMWISQYISKVLEKLGFRVKREFWDIYKAYYEIYKKETFWHGYIIRFWGTTPHWTSKPIFEPRHFLNLTTNITLSEFLNYLAEINGFVPREREDEDFTFAKFSHLFPNLFPVNRTGS
ncbi:ABC transporter substrate-binding protein [Thermococcus sp. GR6]|uniref:ABC transporter substrate-binding protein n=1 Tax=Thermococcus sp. GR6 TaxID=1638256 RepID=UPI00142FFE99|nr:ABC transporter substrate-binding protein [Thermococcus sp. GR6]NJE43228.1 peptide ABC transporter permease [Thermococcus sp. GR6]